MSTIIFGFCWNDSALADAANVNIREAETIEDAARRLDLGWNPAWLTEAGYTAYDATGVAIDDSASTSGPVVWSPEVRPPRLDDGVPDSAQGHGFRRRTGAEIAFLSLWTRAAKSKRVEIHRPVGLKPNTRGALFRDFLIYFLQRSLPDGWKVRHEIPLTHIRGLHMRRDVSGRKSDILIIDDGDRLVAALSSKWSWRSDRGTEAAQMVPLTRYRPDVPYALATAEFPRAASVARESVEDRTYHLCPGWVGAWMAVNELAAGASPQERWPDLESLRQDGIFRAQTLTLNGLDTLVDDLRNSGDIL
ncbi:PDDEXK family nuclease [Streptomyces gossypiisoli]|uniref:hypothetical protein n=1 Tax=Streptomyces gossypiisoli TaxID=2748864 RepID=UPI0015D96589|nr:hypothetical protein [Streptomyces gossypiisoli]